MLVAHRLDVGEGGSRAKVVKGRSDGAIGGREDQRLKGGEGAQAILLPDGHKPHSCSDKSGDYSVQVARQALANTDGARGYQRANRDRIGSIFAKNGRQGHSDVRPAGSHRPWKGG